MEGLGMGYYSSYGERTTAQKALKVFSVLGLIGAVISILVPLGFLYYGSSQPGITQQVSSQLVFEGYFESDSDFMSAMTFFLMWTVIYAATLLAVGVLGIRASNNSEKVRPFLILSSIMLAYHVVAMVFLLVVSGSYNLGTGIRNMVFPLVLVILGAVVNSERRQSSSYWY